MALWAESANKREMLEQEHIHQESLETTLVLDSLSGCPIGHLQAPSDLSHFYFVFLGVFVMCRCIIKLSQCSWIMQHVDSLLVAVVSVVV